MIAIGEASKQSGIGIETIRYYEREGIVPKPERAANNRRLYSSDDVGRLRLLKRLRDLGFPLAEAKAVLDLSENHAVNCEAVKGLAEGHIANVKARITELRKLETALRQLISNCSQGNADCPVLRRLRTELD